MAQNTEIVLVTQRCMQIYEKHCNGGGGRQTEIFKRTHYLQALMFLLGIWGGGVNMPK